MLQTVLYYVFVVIQVILILAMFYFLGKIYLLLSTWLWWDKGQAPYVPTRKDRLKKALEMMKIKKGENFVDLGSGDGAVIIYGAKKYDAHFVGYEINTMLYLITRVKMFFTAFCRKGSVELVRGSYMVPSLSRFDHVYMFSLRAQIRKVLPKLEKELKKGAKVMCVMFPMKSEYFRLVEEDGPEKYKLHLYEKVK